jgi:hypothetical protein
MMTRSEDLPNEEKFLSKTGVSKYALRENGGVTPSTTKEYVFRPEDFYSEEAFLSRMGISKRSLKDTPNKLQDPYELYWLQILSLSTSRNFYFR